MQPPAHLATTRELPERLFAAEHTIAGLVADREATQKALRAWTLALVIAIIGATVTIALAGLAGATAYGELRQTAASNAAQLSEMRAELSATRRMLEHGGR